jgi:hypothetical protein
MIPDTLIVVRLVKDTQSRVKVGGIWTAVVGADGSIDLDPSCCVKLSLGEPVLGCITQLDESPPTNGVWECSIVSLSEPVLYFECMRGVQQIYPRHQRLGATVPA